MKKIYRGIYTYDDGILGKFLPKYVQNLIFFVIFHQIHLTDAKTDHHTKLWQNTLYIKEINFLV